MKTNGPGSSKIFPLWAQLTAGAFLIGLIYYIAINANPYVSAWDEENSSFYETALQGLKFFGINPTSPTALVFWNMDEPDSGPSLRSFNGSPASLRIYGVHPSVNDQLLVRKEWLKFAPRRASLLLDRQQLLQTAFHVRAFPMVYIILPKQKKIFSYLGDINDNRQKMLEIIKSE